MADDKPVIVTPPMAVGQWPTTVYAIRQYGVFRDGERHTSIQMTTTKAGLDQGADVIRKYGDPKISYKARIGHIVWDDEVDIMPDAADAQLDIFGNANPVRRKK